MNVFFSEQTLAQNFQPYLPSPVGLWPLSRSTGTTEVTASKIPGNESWIAYDTLVTPGKYEEYYCVLYYQHIAIINYTSGVFSE